MTATEQLDLFVREGLSAGRSRRELEEVLSEAGWEQNDIGKALSRYVDTEFSPPVPRPTPALTARHTFLYALLFTAMGFVASYLVVLLHALIDLQLPDPGDYPRQALWITQKLRWAAANLMVSTPVFIFMSYYIARSASLDDSIRKSPVRKWLTYLALLVSALIFFGDGTYTVYRLLLGELTARFALKAATVALVSGAVFFYYLHDVERASDEG